VEVVILEASRQAAWSLLRSLLRSHAAWGFRAIRRGRSQRFGFVMKGGTKS